MGARWLPTSIFGDLTAWSCAYGLGRLWLECGEGLGPRPQDPCQPASAASRSEHGEPATRANPSNGGWAHAPEHAVE